MSKFLWVVLIGMFAAVLLLPLVIVRRVKLDYEIRMRTQEEKMRNEEENLLRMAQFIKTQTDQLDVLTEKVKLLEGKK